MARCEGGDPDACARLANIYLDGRLGFREPRWAWVFLAEACDYGDAKACESVRLGLSDVREPVTAGGADREPTKPKGQ